MELGNGVSLTWLGHAAFEVGFPDGRVALIDPWLENPKAPPRAQSLDRVDVVLITHGHFDHLGSAVQIVRERNATAIGIFEISVYLQDQGLPEDRVIGMNKGGTLDLDGVRVTMVHAVHSSSIGGEQGMIPGGDPAGYVLTFPDGFGVYHAGDTTVHADMQLIGELYQPRVAMLPIGGHFTMGPREAARAARLLGVQAVVPMHFGTFPVLAGTPDQLRQELGDSGIEVIALEPGETLR